MPALCDAAVSPQRCGRRSLAPWMREGDEGWQIGDEGEMGAGKRQTRGSESLHTGDERGSARWLTGGEGGTRQQKGEEDE